MVCSGINKVLGVDKLDIIFGTDGWRGLLDSEMNDDTVSLVAQAFADYCNGEFASPQIAIGYDGRRNSKHFATLFSQILNSNNIKVFLSDTVIPTPVLSFYVKAKKLNAGVMITASHNPPEYNGVKFKASYGGPFFTEETLKVEKLLGNSEIKSFEKNVKPLNLLEPYLEQLENLIDFKLIKASNIKPLIDSMSGAGGKLIQEILQSHDCSAETMYGTFSENFSGRFAEPIEKNLIPLSDKLKKDKVYCFGAATDGDADRLGVVLENGEWLSAQETILLLADFIKNSKKISGGLVKTSSVTDKLKSSFESPDCKIYDVQVGFKYICEKMIEEDVAFGAEESGGFGYKLHIPERDGILSALFILEMLASSGFKKLSEYVNNKKSELGEIYYDRIDYHYNKPDRTTKLPSIFSEPLQEITGIKLRSIDHFLSSRGLINGLKFTLDGETRWLLMRASETEPLIRIYAEGQNKDEVKNFLDFGITLINK